MLKKLLELHCLLRLYHSNFFNLHWNTKGEEFNDAHKGITTDYYEMCFGYIDETAEMLARLGVNPPNYVEAYEVLDSSELECMLIDSKALYTRKEIIAKADKMLEDICFMIESVLASDEIEDTSNAGIKSDLEAMHSKFDIEYRYINKRRMM